MIGERAGTVTGVRIAGPGSELLPDDGPFDVFLENGRIADIAPAGAVRPRGLVLDGAGAWLVPGLWDHHVHVTQWALASQRHELAGAASAVEAAHEMAGAAVLADGRRVGTGYRDALWPDAPSLDVLDAATGDIPTYLVNADVHSAWLNSAALRREGMISPDGVLREEPAFEISRRLNAVDPDTADTLVTAMARRAAARGVVGVVDLDLAWNHEAWERRVARGLDLLRVSYGVYPEHLDAAIAAGLRSGDPLGDGLVRMGPLKIISDGSLGTRTAACTHAHAQGDTGVLTVGPDELAALLTRATGAGLACAVHAIGDVANSSALDAFAVSGAVGTIEHAQLVAHADLARFGRLGVAASVQPEHALDDRALVDALWAAQTALAYPLRSLHAAGADLRFGSDAPVAPLDPWRAIAAAVFRSRDGDSPWHAEETVPLEVALAASTGGGSQNPSTIAVGSPADVVLVDADPTTADEPGLRAMPVRATLLGGRVTHLL
ncbi:amidohydrolase [Microbacterium sp. SORGH_AS_0888]|uniref:amidohydrolase n=1 Tax=Microbacterium sp. SORGH_AS_0888 TaxID=3041791 RepID=UPI00277DFC53|nr:amidohydrolase family protein [Microbacterium sp. SORGH_AS_0888]MDQ1128735.1 putative amidohydrolase YtcJ [Microbacterium sp. SORGH_AS_0888]